MKQAKDLIQNRRKTRFWYSLDQWCRQISSLRGAAERRESASRLSAPSGRPAVWERVLADTCVWSDKKDPNHSDIAPRDALLLRPQSLEGQLENTGACRPAYQHGFEHENFGRIAMHEGTCSKLCREGALREAVEALDLLVQTGSYVSTSLFYRVLKRCTVQKDLVLGRHVHALTLKSGYERDTFLANHLICMYSSNGMLDEATQVFSKVDTPDAYMWTSMILAHARHGQPTQGIKLYRQMRQSNIKPDTTVFLAILKACAGAADLSFGKEVHADILKSKVEFDMFVGNCLVDMYAKCGSLMDACKVFDSLPTRDAVTWNSMIAGYIQHGLGNEALSLYARMQEEGVTPATSVTFVSLLQACSSMGALHQGQQLHAQIRETGLEGDVVVGSSLVEMYAKCRSLEEARSVFDRLPIKDVVTWTVMIAGYVQHDLGQEALALFGNMEQCGIFPNKFTFPSLLRACASVGALHIGKKLHAQIQEKGLEADVVVGNSLVDMYGKCGSLENARAVFDRLQTRDVVTWNSMMAGYAQHGRGQEAILLFESMQQGDISTASVVGDNSMTVQEMRHRRVEPDGATFICLLVACSHDGLVDAGRQFFKLMVECHGIVASVAHYNCMVDLLGRSGFLDEAENLLRTMPFDNDVIGWTSLLTACKGHGDLERAKRCFDSLTTLDPENGTAYALLETMYAHTGRFRDAEAVERLRKHAGALKKPAMACIEVKNKVHEFIVGEERADISLKLRSVNLRLTKEGGHVPQTDKEDTLCGHAEKLALAYGLLNTPDGTTLLVTKNLRMCDDCHIGTKIMSRLEKREIIVRDAHRVHRFVDGSCSCRDRH